jgi:hypothetical protein
MVSRLAGPRSAPADWGVFRKPSDVASKKLSEISAAFGLRYVFRKELIIEHITTSLHGSALRALALPVSVLRQFGQFDHQITGCLWVQEHDPAITMPDHRFLLLETNALGAKLGHCRVDILDLEAEVEEPLAVLGDPPARSECQVCRTRVIRDRSRRQGTWRAAYCAAADALRIRAGCQAFSLRYLALRQCFSPQWQCARCA